jgi:hypothetical protein
MPMGWPADLTQYARSAPERGAALGKRGATAGG